MPRKTKRKPALSSKARPRTGGRSARVVKGVLEAALQAFAAQGYAGLSMEGVALSAGVNKTTVYRRWPTKAELLGDALFSLRDNDPELPNTGSLRADLLQILRFHVAQMVTPHRRAIMHAFLLSNTEPELQSLVRRLRHERPVLPPLVIERAIRRGELPRGSDPRLIIDALMGPLHTRAYWKHEPVTEEFLSALVHLVVAGASAGGARPPG
jgi:AcrR family transcriptional regulator